MAPRLIFVHPSLLSYRRDFFERVATEYQGETIIYFSPTVVGVLSDIKDMPVWARSIGPILSILPGVDWQKGAVGIPLERGDILVVSGAPRCLSNLVLLVRARMKGVTTIWWGHYHSPTSTRMRSALRLALARTAHALLFYTGAEVLRYRQSVNNQDKRPIHALNNGIDTDPVRLLRVPYVPAVRERAVLFVGRLTAKAELRSAIEALAHPDAKGIELHVIGDGPEGEALGLLADDLGVAERVRWHGATTDERRISRVANACRVFLYPGQVGLSLIHAMAYGLPAVLHDNANDQMPEYSAFESGLTGRCFARGDTAALAATLREMIDDFDALCAFSGESLRRVEDDYNTRAMSKRLVTLLGILDSGQ